MFTCAGSSLSSRMLAIACAAKASFSSIRSIWSIVSPARLRTFWVAGMGPSPMQEGSTPATAVATMREWLGLPGGHEQRRGPIVDPTRACRGHRAVLLEGGLQVRHALERRAAARILVFCKRATVGEGDRHELVREHARLERRPGAALALDGEGILLGARDLVALRDQLGRLAQRDRPVLFEPGIREPPSNGRVRGLRGLAAPRFARFEGYVGRARHVFDPARDEYVALTGLDRLRGAGGRLESRAAQPVHRLAGNLHRKAREQQRHPSHVAVVLPGLIRAPEDHVVDGAGVDTGALNDRLDGNRGKIIRAHTGQGPAVFANGST